MLVIPAFQACMQSALFRANIKPPVELVVANLESRNWVWSSKKAFSTPNFACREAVESHR